MLLVGGAARAPPWKPGAQMNNPTPEPQNPPSQGHWLLASLGKKVLRPGGWELTQQLVQELTITDQDIVEFAPGLGKTAQLLHQHHPKSYTGIDKDPTALATLQKLLGPTATCTHGDAQQTGLPAASADVVIGEAMLTMQGPAAKAAIVSEAARILRPGGSYGIHELGLQPETIDEDLKAAITKDLAGAIRVNARPLTLQEWSKVLADQGFNVQHSHTAPMALLEPRRIISDEGPAGAAKFLFNVARKPQARARVLQMRAIFRKYADHLCAIAIVAKKAS